MQLSPPAKVNKHIYAQPCVMAEPWPHSILKEAKKHMMIHGFTYRKNQEHNSHLKHLLFFRAVDTFIEENPIKIVIT